MTEIRMITKAERDTMIVNWLDDLKAGMTDVESAQAAINDAYSAWLMYEATRQVHIGDAVEILDMTEVWPEWRGRVGTVHAMQDNGAILAIQLIGEMASVKREWVTKL